MKKQTKIMKENLIQYSKKDVSIFRKIYSTKVGDYRNKTTLDSYIRELLKNVYEPKGKWVNSRDQGGVFNTGYKYEYDGRSYQDDGRSLLNKLDTHYTAHYLLINWINREIINGNIKGFTQIDFYLSSWINEIQKLFKILDIYKSIIFNNNSEILPELLTAIRTTSEIGDTAERITVKKLMAKGITDIKQASFGDENDIKKGIDIVFSYNNHKNKKIQTKSYRKMEITNDHYIFYIIGIKQYKVDYYSFYNKYKGFYMFSNSDTIEYGENQIKIPKNLKRDI